MGSVPWQRRLGVAAAVTPILTLGVFSSFMTGLGLVGILIVAISEHLVARVKIIESSFGVEIFFPLWTRTLLYIAFVLPLFSSFFTDLNHLRFLLLSIAVCSQLLIFIPLIWIANQKRTATSSSTNIFQRISDLKDEANSEELELLEELIYNEEEKLSAIRKDIGKVRDRKKQDVSMKVAAQKLRSDLRAILTKEREDEKSVESHIPKLILISVSIDFYFLLCYALPIAFISYLQRLPFGPWYILGTMLVSWGTDTGALVAGSCFGKKIFLPEVSPKKTVEGIFGSVISGPICVCLYKLITRIFFSHPNFMGFREIFLMSVLIPILGIQGDLIESSYKRVANIKDTGRIFGPHGGMIDRLDSLAILYPFVYFLI